MINNLPEYIKLNNAYNPAHYPANKKISAEEWNALWLSVMYQGNHQEDILASILNITIPENITNINNLINITEEIDLKATEALSNSEYAVETANNAESVALGIDAKASEALANSEDAVDTADEAKAIALSIEQAKVFDTFSDMETWLKDEANKGLHTTGLELLIKSNNVPDYWITEVLDIPNASGYYYDIEENEATVLSVNEKKGIVVLKTDDISDTDEANKWSTTGEKEKVSKIVINGDGTKALLNDGTYGEAGTIDTVSINGGEPILPDENKNIDITITADNIPDTSTTNKFATAEDLAQIATNTGDITDLQNNKADKATTLTGYGITDAYTKTEIESKIASVYKYKGSVANYASLPTDNLTVGDVYNVEDTGDNYAWTGSEWDKLSGTVDLSNYATKLSIPIWSVPYRDEAGPGEPNTSKLATMTSPLPSAILIRDTEGKATFVGGTSASQGIVKSQLDSALANMVTTNTEQTITGVKTFSNNIKGTLNGNANSSTYCSRLKGVDTRDTNETPEWYYTGQSVNTRTFLSEFKTTSVLGLSGSDYCLLLTCVPWGDATGGLPSQTAYLSDGKKYVRHATSTTTWSDWKKEATTEDVDNAIKGIDYLKDHAKTYLVIKTPADNDTFTLLTGTTGSPNYTIEWGDGSSDNITSTANPSHLYEKAGMYLITISGSFSNGILFGSSANVNKSKIIEVYGGSNYPLSVEINAFRNCTSLTTANFPNATDISDTAFYGCSSLTTANFSNVTSMGILAFYNCSSLKELTLGNVTATGAYGNFENVKLINLTIAQDVTNTDIDRITTFFKANGGRFIGNETKHGLQIEKTPTADNDVVRKIDLDNKTTQYSTMPTAKADNVGETIQYLGDTISSSYTSFHTGETITGTTVDLTIFEKKFDLSRRFQVYYNGTVWKETTGYTTVDLEDYGITYTGTASTNNYITVYYTQSFIPKQFYKCSLFYFNYLWVGNVTNLVAENSDNAELQTTTKGVADYIDNLIGDIDSILDNINGEVV